MMKERNDCDRGFHRDYIFRRAMKCARTNGGVELKNPTDVPKS